MANEKLSAELSRIRKEVEDLQEDCLATAVPAEVLERVEAVLTRLAVVTGAVRDAGL
jgi:hypothetical protein